MIVSATQSSVYSAVHCCYMKEVKCDILQKEYREFKELTERCKSVLLQRGIASDEYRVVREQFEQKKENLQQLITERKEFFAHLQDLFFKSRKYINGKWSYDPEIQEIFTRYGADREALAYIFNCREDQISFTQEEALSGDIVFHQESLYLWDLTSATDLQLPKHVGGYLDLRGLTSATDLQLPEHVGRNLYLGGLTSATDLQLPEHVGGDLWLNALTPQDRNKIREEHPDITVYPKD